MPISRTWLRSGVCGAAMIGLGAFAMPAQAGKYSVIHDFTPPPNSGALSTRVSTPVFGQDGCLYGVVTYQYSDGTDTIGNELFRLAPPTPGHTAWTYTAIYNFLDDSAGEPQTLLVTSGGTLIGAKSEISGYRNSSLVRFDPPASGNGSWTETEIYGFGAADGSLTAASLTAIPGGAFIGTADSGIYQASPPGPGQLNWGLTFPYHVTPKPGALGFYGTVWANDGSLFGPAYVQTNNNIIWRLAPLAPGQTTRPLQTIAMFGISSSAGFGSGIPVLDRAHNLYDFNRYTVVGSSGVRDIGTVFRLSPPTASQASWHEDILYAFKGLEDGGSPTGLVEGPDGRLYGVNRCYYSYDSTTYCSQPESDTIFSLTPRDYGGHQVPWNHAILHTFGQSTDGLLPESLVKTTLADSTFALFGETIAGGAKYAGTIFEYIP